MSNKPFKVSYNGQNVTCRGTDEHQVALAFYKSRKLSGKVVIVVEDVATGKPRTFSV